MLSCTLTIWNQHPTIKPLHFLDIKFSIFVASQSFNHRGNHEKSGLTQWSIAGVMLKRHWLQFQTFFNSFGLSILIKCSPKVHGNHFVLKCQICKVFVSVGAEIVQSFMHFFGVFSWSRMKLISCNFTLMLPPKRNWTFQKLGVYHLNYTAFGSLSSEEGGQRE